MLSRMNLTLSALALSNGLNLGTRSRAANADVNLDGQTLYILSSHHDVMREGVDAVFLFEAQIETGSTAHSRLNFPGSGPATELRNVATRRLGG